MRYLIPIGPIRDIEPTASKEKSLNKKAVGFDPHLGVVFTSDQHRLSVKKINFEEAVDWMTALPEPGEPHIKLTTATLELHNRQKVIDILRESDTATLVFVTQNELTIKTENGEISLPIEFEVVNDFERVTSIVLAKHLFQSMRRFRTTKPIRLQFEVYYDLLIVRELGKHRHDFDLIKTVRGTL